MNLLVTGAAGFIGSAISRKALKIGYEVYGLDCFLPDLYSNAPKEDRIKVLKNNSKFHFIDLDIRDDLTELNLNGIDLIIHCAAMAGLKNSWSNFKTYQDCNSLGTFNLVSKTVNYPGIHFIYASTSSVYGKYAVGNERSQILPASPYGITKYAAEQIVRNFEQSHGLSATILRLFSVYGPDQRPDMAFSKFISAMHSNKSIEIYGDGLQIRTNTYIDDAVDAFFSVSDTRFSGQTFNVAGDESHNLLEFIDLCSSIMKVSPDVKFLESRLGDQIETKGDSNLLSELTGWQPKINFEQGVLLQIESFLNK